RARAPPPARGGPLPVARWRRLTAEQALRAKDALLATRPGPLRDRVPGPLLCAVVSAVLWALPLELGIVHVASFVLLLVAAGLWGVCLIAACASDPPGLVRALPLGLRDVWGARAR